MAAVKAKKPKSSRPHAPGALNLCSLGQEAALAVLANRP
jgi:hypothetical protein